MNILKNLHLSEQSDLLNPLVVKELRQELRLKSFINIFIWSQLILGMVTLLTLASAGENPSSGLLTFSFWAALSLPLFVILPRRAFLSFGKESDAKTLEPLLLTTLSPWQITVGKWSALALQVFLFVTAATPYLFLGYFTGGENPLETLEVTLILVVLSLFILAMGISGSSATGGRKGGMVFVIILGLLLLYALSMSLRASSFRGYGPTSSTFLLGPDDYLALIPLIPLAILLILDSAVSRISPPYEYPVKPRRLLLLCLVLWCALITAVGLSVPPLIVGASLLFVIPGFISSLFEPIHPLIRRSRSITSFIRASLRYPGWPGSIAIGCCIVYLLVGLSMAGLKEFHFTLYLLVTGQILSGILVPLVIVIGVFPPERRGFKQYFGSHMLLLMVGTLLSLPMAIGVNLIPLTSFVPHGSFMLIDSKLHFKIIAAFSSTAAAWISLAILFSYAVSQISRDQRDRGQSVE